MNYLDVCPALMNIFVAVKAQCYQVFWGMLPTMTTKNVPVVELQPVLTPGTAHLTLARISL